MHNQQQAQQPGGQGQFDDLRALLKPHKGYGPVREHLMRFNEARRARLLLLTDLIPPPGGTCQ